MEAPQVPEGLRPQHRVDPRRVADKVAVAVNKGGNTPAAVAKVITATATDAKPKLRHAAGPTARRVSTARRIVPARAFDQLIRKADKPADRHSRPTRENPGLTRASPEYTHQREGQHDHVSGRQGRRPLIWPTSVLSHMHTLHDQPGCSLGVFVPAGLHTATAQRRHLDRLAQAGPQPATGARSTSRRSPPSPSAFAPRAHCPWSWEWGSPTRPSPHASPRWWTPSSSAPPSSARWPPPPGQAPDMTATFAQTLRPNTLTEARA
jgi:hypothetical protein